MPTPLGFFFGIFYFPDKRSGVIPPKYGGFSERGFCIKDGGYYFNFNDYLDLSLTGDIYSKGSVGFRGQSRYKQRYQYSGDLSYSRDVLLEPNERFLPKPKKSWRFTWNHRTENNRTSSIAAKVDLQSEAYRTSLVERGDGLNASMDSSIRYTNKLVGLPYSLNLNLRYSKNFQTNDTKVILPEVSLRTGNIYPLRSKRGLGGRWYSDIHFQHIVDFKHKLSNKVEDEILDFSPENWSILRKNAKYGIKNTVPVKTNVKLGYFNFTPGMEHRYRLYFEKLDYTYDPTTQKVDEKTLRGLAQVYDCDFSLGLNTTLYGTHFFGKRAAVQAIRHQMEPKLNFVYTPDFSGPTFDYWQRIKTDKGEVLYNRFRDGVYGSPPNRAKAVLQAHLKNALEMKVRQQTDDGPNTKKFPILEGFDWSTGYDFLAEAFPLEDIRLQARTRLFDNLININYNAAFDPYAWVDDPKATSKAQC